VTHRYKVQHNSGRNGAKVISWTSTKGPEVRMAVGRPVDQIGSARLDGAGSIPGAATIPQTIEGGQGQFP
jgi:hypothetical protein